MANTVTVTILSRTSGFSRGINSASRQLSGFQRVTKGTQGVFGTFAKGFIGTALAFSGVQMFKGFISDAREARKVTAITNQHLKTTGGVANVTSKHVGKLADSLARKTGVDDELIQTGSNLLLTFKNVRNEAGKGAAIFDRATTAAVDLSASGFGSVESSSKMLGKALNDPIKGITALSRAGVTFTDQQKEQIATLVKSGDTLGAQKIIMAEVESQVGGTAAASADAGDRLRQTMQQISEAIGAKLLPILDKVATYLVNKLPGWIRTAKSAFAGVKDFFQPFIDAVSKVTGPLEKLKGPLDTVIGFLKANPAVVKTFAGVLIGLGVAIGIVSVAMGILGAIMAINPFVLAIVGIAALAAAMVYAWKNSETFRTVVKGAFEVVKGAVSAFMPVITSLWTTVKTVFSAVIQIIKGAFQIIKGIFQVIAGVIKGDWSLVWSGLKNIVSGAWNIIVGILRAGWAIIKGIFTAGFAVIKGVFTVGWNVLKAIVKTVWSAIKAAVSAGFNAIKSVVKSGVNAVKSAFSSGWNAAKSVTSSAWNAIKSAVSKGVSNVVSLAKSLPGKIKSGLGNLGSMLKSAGTQIIQGLINGIKAMASRAVSAAKGVVSDAVKGAKSLLGISSPSKVFAEIGKNTTLGLIEGMESKSRALARSVNGLVGIVTSASPALSSVQFGSRSGSLALAGAGGGGGNTYNVTVVVDDTMSPAEYARKIADAVTYGQKTGIIR